jgi:proline iminopeptidase
MVQDAGHAFDEPGIVDALVRSTDRFAESPAHPARSGQLPERGSSGQS